MENNSNKKLMIICGTIVACIAILCITAGAIIAMNQNSTPANQTQQPAATEQNVQNSQNNSGSSTQNQNSSQNNDGYQNIINQVKDGKLLIAPTNESTGKTLSVAYRDINGDSVEEMFMGYDNVWWSVFTLQNNSASKIVQKENARDALTLREDNTILRVKVSADGEDTEHNVFSFPAALRLTGRVDDDTGDGATLLYHAEKSHDRDDWYAEYEIGVGATDRDCNQADYEAYLGQMNVNAAAANLSWSNVG